MEEDIIYSINIGDIQTVAKEVLKRALTEQELMQVAESVPKYIDWFLAIENAIWENEHDLIE